MDVIFLYYKNTNYLIDLVEHLPLGSILVRMTKMCLKLLL